MSEKLIRFAGKSGVDVLQSTVLYCDVVYSTVLYCDVGYSTVLN